LNALVAANSKFSYLVTEDLSYRWNPISNVSSRGVGYFVHVHHGNDDAGSRENKCFSGNDLPTLVQNAVSFIQSQ
jgi:hypothetical protein